MSKIVVILKGGLGNQLFCYAAARRLALVNNAELVIDTISGFTRDFKYKRQFMLAPFNISARVAKPSERLIPFERFRRFIMKVSSKRKPYEFRRYLIEENYDFDERLLMMKVENTVYLDGYWQSEKYFIDIENIIRHEFEIKPPIDKLNLKIAALIKSKNGVSIHIRWFDRPVDEKETSYSNNIDKEYYNKALAVINEHTTNPYFFIFSDLPDEAIRFLPLHKDNVTYIKHNIGDENAYVDLWLMSLCRHFIIANSTFSWWGAWLSVNPNKIVIAPQKEKNGEGVWGFKGLIPENWRVI